MAEPARNEAPAPTSMDEQHDPLQEQKQPPTLPLEDAAIKAPEERNEELEIAIRGALEGPGKDLGRLCKTLGENFCLAPPRPKKRVVRAAGYDSGSDTTSPADQEHSGSSSGGSETGGDHAAAAVSGGGGGRDKAAHDSEDDEHGEVLRAVAAAARVRCAMCACCCRCCCRCLCPEWGKGRRMHMLVDCSFSGPKCFLVFFLPSRAIFKYVVRNQTGAAAGARPCPFFVFSFYRRFAYPSSRSTHTRDCGRDFNSKME